MGYLASQAGFSYSSVLVGKYWDKLSDVMRLLCVSLL